MAIDQRPTPRDLSSGTDRSVYDGQAAPEDWIQSIKTSSKPPPTPPKPSYGIDSPAGLAMSSIAAPLYLYSTLHGKHALWRDLLDGIPPSTWEGPTLDVGCGRGMVLLQVAQRKMDAAKKLQLPVTTPTYGIDIFNTGDQSGNAPTATYANAAALGLLDHVVLHTASFTERLPFRDEAFTLCTSSLAVHNVGDEGRRQAIREMARVCCRGGSIVVLDLVPYVAGYKETLEREGWTEIECRFGGAKVMFGLWPCQVMIARKPM